MTCKCFDRMSYLVFIKQGVGREGGVLLAKPKKMIRRYFIFLPPLQLFLLTFLSLLLMNYSLDASHFGFVQCLVSLTWMPTSKTIRS